MREYPSSFKSSLDPSQLQNKKGRLIFHLYSFLKQSWEQWIVLNFRKINKANIKNVIQNFDIYSTIEGVSQFLQKKRTSLYGMMIAIIAVTYGIADLTVLWLEEVIPNGAVFSSSYDSSHQSHSLKTMQTYASLLDRNLFNSQGLMPGDAVLMEPAVENIEGVPIRTKLPLKLIGTLIMKNPLRSIATIEDTPNTMVYPMRVEDEIPKKIKILEIEIRKVIFLNLSSKRKEFAILDEDEISNSKMNLLGNSFRSSGVEQLGSNQFHISRAEVDRTLSDFNNILTQARAVPNFENGVSAGYRLFQIVPGSIYDKLGLQNGDVISGINGQPISDPRQAFEMLSDLKTTSHLELQIKKDGKASPTTYRYDIH